MRVSINVTIATGRIFEFNVEPTTTVETLKEQLRTKLQLPEDDKSFRNSILSRPEGSLANESKTLEEYDISEGTVLTYYVLGNRTRNILNSGLTFVDVSNKSTLERLSWGASGPRWWVAARGFCLEGICKTETCEAYGNRVIMNMGFLKFDMLADPDETTTFCPVCKKYVAPITCAFNNCEWYYRGKKMVSNDSSQPPESCKSEWIRADDAYHRFNDTNGEQVCWRQLIIEARK